MFRNPADYYFSPTAFTLSQSKYNGSSDWLSLSVRSGARIKVKGTTPTHNPAYTSNGGKIGYNDQLNTREWTFVGGPVKLADTYKDSALYLYLRLSAAIGGTSGEMFFSLNNYDIDGFKLDDHDLDIAYKAAVSDGEFPQGDWQYFYVCIGLLTAPDANGIRKYAPWDASAQGGLLETDRQTDQQGDSLFVYNPSSRDVTPKYPFTDINVKTSLTLFAKVINAIKTDTVDFTDWISNTALATTASITSFIYHTLKELDDKFLRKDKDDETKFGLTMHNLHVNDASIFEGLASFCNDIALSEGTVLTGVIHSKDGILSDAEVSAPSLYVDSISKKDVSDNAAIKVVSSLRTSGITEDSSISSSNCVKDIIGEGYALYKEGSRYKLVVDDIIARQSLRTIDLVYDRVRVDNGTRWLTKGAGKVDTVSADGKTVTLDLEDGDAGSFMENDLCIGVWRFEDGNADSDSPDGLTIKGFTTLYFKVKEVSGDRGEVLLIQSLNGSVAPSHGMTVVQFGNTENTDRQACAYETTTFKRYLYGIDSVEKLGKVECIGAQFGDLTNLKINGTQLSGYSAYLNNVYFAGVVQQLRNEGLNIWNYRGAYDSMDTYSTGDVVSHGDAMYVWRSSQPGQTEPPSDEWAPFGEQGRGITGITCDFTASAFSSESDMLSHSPSWQTAQPLPNDTAKYIWQRTSVSFTDGSPSISYSIVAVYTPGQQGDSVKSSKTVYAYQSHNNGTFSTSDSAYTGELNAFPAITNGKFVWRKMYFYKSTAQIASNLINSTPWECVQGMQGSTGLTGPSVRFCGTIQTNRTYYNNASWIDVVLYNNQYYKLKSATSYTPSSANIDTSVWEQFSNFSALAASVLLAGSGYIDVLGAGSLFVGATVDNKQGDLNRNGWIMTQGRIYHTQTGLELTADGRLYSPDGLHLKVGNDSYSGGIANPNLIADALFSSPGQFTGTGGRSGCYLSRVQQSGSAGATYNYKSPFGGWMYQFGVNNSSSSVGSVYGTPTNFAASLKTSVEPNSQYTFSLWFKVIADKDDTYLAKEYSQIAEVDLWTAAGGKTTANVSRFNIVAEIGGFKQVAYTFTTSSSQVFMSWLPYFTVAAGQSGFYVLYAAAKLEKGSIASAISLTDVALKQTGIDISQGLIKITSDNFQVENNQGEDTFKVDEDGNISLFGAVNTQNTIINQANHAKRLIKNVLNDSFDIDLTKCGDIITLDGDLADTGNIFSSGGQINLPSAKSALGRKIQIYNDTSATIYLNGILAVKGAATENNPRLATLLFREGTIAVLECCLQTWPWTEATEHDALIYWKCSQGGKL